MTWIIIIGGSVLIILLIVGIVVSSNSERSLVEERLGQYLVEGKPGAEADVQRSVITDWVSKRVEKTSYGDRIARDLARADLKFKVAEYFVLIALAILLLGVIAWFLGNQHPISFLIAKMIVKIKYISLPNIIAGKQINTELIQDDFTAKNLIHETEKLLDNEDIYNLRKSELKEVNKLLGNQGAVR